MGRRCATCAHPDREAIDVAILTGRPLRRIAAYYGLSEGSARRHAEGCISDDVREAITGKRRDRPADLSDKLLAAAERVVEVRARIEGRTTAGLIGWTARDGPVKRQPLPIAALLAHLDHEDEG